MQNNDRAPEDVRRRNTLAIHQRNRWRRQYKILADMIKEQKTFLKRYPNNGEEAIRLFHLQERARLMMLDRSDISWELINTAYKWTE